MNHKLIHSLTLLATIVFTSVQAAEKPSPASTQPTKTEAKKTASPQSGGTYRDEIEIMKFDEYTGRDSYSIPFEEEGLETNQKTQSAPKN